MATEKIEPTQARNSAGYIATRNAVLLKVEDFYPKIYIDTVGVPTISVGVNLIPKGRDGNVAVSEERVALLEEAVGRKLPELRAKLQDVVTAAKGTRRNANNCAKGSDPNWLARVALRAVTARPSGDCLAGHRALEAANDMAWRAVA